MPEKPEKPKKTIEIILLIGVIILVIANINLGSRLTNLENALNNLNHNLMFHNDMNSVNNSLWELSHRIDEVSEQITQSTSLSFGEVVLIHEYNQSASSADVEISFYLREHNIEDTVHVTARGRDGRAYSAEADLLNGKFTAAMTIPVRDNYTFTFTSSGETLTTGKLKQFNLMDELRLRFSYFLWHSESWGTNQPTTINFSPEFTNFSQGNEALEIRVLSLIIELEDIIIKTWDLMPYLENIGDTQGLQLDWDSFAVTLDNEPEDIDFDTVVTAKLVIYDNLGIRYEQTDLIFVSHFISDSRHGGRMFGGGTSVAPAPHTWAGHWDDGWGSIRIVE